MRLIDCFIDLIAYVSYFTISESKLSFNQVSNDISGLITKSFEIAEKNQIEMEAYEKAKFAICSWIDESIMESPWSEKFEWQKNLLQTTIFKTSDSGLLFFEKLNDLRVDENDVREVFFLCIALGFTGIYSLEGDDFKLEQLKSINSKLLTGSAMGAFSMEGQKLFPDSYHIDAGYNVEKKFKRKKSNLLVMAGLIPLGIIISMLFLFNFILNSEITSGLIL
ncbi:MAG: DotU family type IV/VI secretion system protein [Desulfobacteraceae bacterium]|nr:DotU family type IV/VI secretion system protein [Desulfobacteraceae bacterium]